MGISWDSFSVNSRRVFFVENEQRTDGHKEGVRRYRFLIGVILRVFGFAEKVRVNDKTYYLNKASLLHWMDQADPTTKYADCTLLQTCLEKVKKGEEQNMTPTKKLLKKNRKQEESSPSSSRSSVQPEQSASKESEHSASSSSKSSSSREHSVKEEPKKDKSASHSEGDTSKNEVIEVPAGSSPERASSSRENEEIKDEVAESSTELAESEGAKNEEPAEIVESKKEKSTSKSSEEEVKEEPAKAEESEKEKSASRSASKSAEEEAKEEPTKAEESEKEKSASKSPEEEVNEESAKAEESEKEKSASKSSSEEEVNEESAKAEESEKEKSASKSSSEVEAPKSSLADVEEVEVSSTGEEPNPEHILELRKSLFREFPKTLEILNGADPWESLTVEELGGRCTFLKADPWVIQKFKEENDVLAVRFETVEDTSGILLNAYKTESENGKVTMTIPWKNPPRIEVLTDADAKHDLYYHPILTAYANIFLFAKEHKIPNIQIDGFFDIRWSFDLHENTRDAWQTNVKLLFLSSVKRWAFTEDSPIKEVLLVEDDPKQFVLDPAAKGEAASQLPEVAIEEDLPSEPAKDQAAEAADELPALIEAEFPPLSPTINKEQPHSEK